MAFLEDLPIQKMSTSTAHITRLMGRAGSAGEGHCCLGGDEVV